MRRLNFQSLVTILVAVLSSLVAGNCNQFNASTDYYTNIAPRQIISKGFVCDTPKSDYTFADQMRCNPSNQCPIISYGVINGIGRNNLSLTEDQVLPLYNLVYATTSSKPLTFLYSLSDTLGNTSSCLDVGGTNTTAPPAGYFIFTPDLLCIQGTLSQCTNGPVDNDTPIEICGMYTYGETPADARLEGTSNFVTVDYPGVATEIPVNPAATVSPVAREPASTTGSASGSSPTSGAECIVARGVLSGLMMGVLLVL